MAAKAKVPVAEQGRLVKISSCFSGLVDRHEKTVGQFTESQEYRDAWRASICSTSSAITLANWPRLSHSKLKGSRPGRSFSGRPERVVAESVRGHG